VGTATQMCERVAGHLARTLGDVAGLPVHGRCGVLHEDPRLASAYGAAEVCGDGQPDVRVLVGGPQIVVVRDDVDLAAPGPQIRGPALIGHEVGRDGLVGVRADRVAFDDEALPQLVVGEAGEV